MPCDQRKIFVVVPTIRADSFDKFFINWLTLFLKHRVTLVVVQDGPDPHIDVFEFKNAIVGTTDEFKRKRVAMGARAVLGMENVDMFYNFSDSIRNAGFAYAIMNGASVVISLDDDVAPVGDTIQDHINALDNSYPISWMNTANEHYMRGFPYSVRHEAECVLSHGGWTSVADFDGQTQLKLESESETNTIPAVTIRRMPVPKGVLFPFCAMNFAFKRKFAPWVYQAPAIDDIQRFSDIWSGICMKSMIDEMGWCAVTGYAMVDHQRASDALTNMKKEAHGIVLNETFWENPDALRNHPYFVEYVNRRERWADIINDIIDRD